MPPVTVRAFVSVPPCSGGVALKRLLGRIQAQFGERIEVIWHTGLCPELEEYAITAAPALVVGDLVKFVGVVPSEESLVSALREAGLE